VNILLLRFASLHSMAGRMSISVGLSVEDLLFRGGSNYLDFLTAADLARLMNSCKSLRESIRGHQCWKEVIFSPNRRKGLVLWKHPRLRSKDESWCDFLRNFSCRLTLRISIYLPEILGYSLVHTHYPDFVRELELKPVSERNCRIFVPVGMENTATEKTFYSFDNPYMMYWIVTSILIRTANDEKPTLLTTQKLMSMNAVTVTPDELDSKNWRPNPQSTCITSAGSNQNKVYFSTRRSNAKVQLFTPFAELTTLSLPHANNIYCT